MLWDPRYVLVHFSAAPLPIQVPACGLQGSQGWPKALGCCPNMEDLEGDPGSLALGFTLVQLWLFWPLGGQTSRWIFLSVSPLCKSDISMKINEFFLVTTQKKNH